LVRKVTQRNDRLEEVEAKNRQLELELHGIRAGLANGESEPSAPDLVSSHASTTGAPQDVDQVEGPPEISEEARSELCPSTQRGASQTRGALRVAAAAPSLRQRGAGRKGRRGGGEERGGAADEANDIAPTPALPQQRAVGRGTAGAAPEFEQEQGLVWAFAWLLSFFLADRKNQKTSRSWARAMSRLPTWALALAMVGCLVLVAISAASVSVRGSPTIGAVVAGGAAKGFPKGFPPVTGMPERHPAPHAWISDDGEQKNLALGPSPLGKQPAAPRAGAKRKSKQPPLSTSTPTAVGRRVVGPVKARSELPPHHHATTVSGALPSVPTVAVVTSPPSSQSTRVTPRPPRHARRPSVSFVLPRRQ
jgi:hypothetical protein